MSFWDDAVGYEVYIRSFADGNGDGIGDFDGLTERLDHLAWLGVDIVWVSPFYPSPMADFGYDVADYRSVEPRFGDLAAFDAFVAKAKTLGLRVMVDLVPNHTSSEHRWFRSALEDRQSPRRAFYLFRAPGADGGPPNNWVSHFGGPAWTLDEKSGEYYCHLFLPEQPDLNWANEDVRAEFDAILAFWIARGADGFRIDVAHALAKDPELRDNPQIAEVTPASTPAEAFAAFEHVHDLNQEGTLDIYRRWKAGPARDAFLLGEVYVDDPLAGAHYLGRDGLDHALFFGLNRRPWDAAAFVDTLKVAADASPQGFAWTISSHDENRPATRFGGGDLGRDRALAIWSLFVGLPGVPFLYQGEELGLEDGRVAPEDVRDPVGKKAYEEGRDPARTPMPWEAGTPQHGFTSAEEAWLKSAPRSDAETVAVQREDPTSPLHRYRRLLAIRKRLAPRREGTVEWLAAPETVAAFRRGDVVHVANLGDTEVSVALPAGRFALEHDTRSEATPESRSGTVSVPPATGLVLARASGPA